MGVRAREGRGVGVYVRGDVQRCLIELTKTESCTPVHVCPLEVYQKNL